MIKQLVKNLDFQIYDCVSRLTEKLVFNDQISENIDWCEYHQATYKTNANISPDKTAGRTAWLLLFGQKHRFKYKSKVYDVFMAGTSAGTSAGAETKTNTEHDNLLKVKKMVGNKSEYVEGDLRKTIQDEFLKTLNETYIVSVPSPPEFYKWNFKHRNNVDLRYDSDTQCFYVNESQVKTLDLSDLIVPVDDVVCYPGVIPTELKDLIEVSTYSSGYDSDYFLESLLERMDNIIQQRRLKKDHRVFEWNIYSKQMPSNLWRMILARIYTSDIDTKDGKFVLMTCPCDRRGKKTNNSISYKFEGTIHRIFMMLECLYPFMMVRRCQSSSRLSIKQCLSIDI